MSNRMIRTQILLEPEQHQKLSELAKHEQRTLSDLVREMLQTQLERRQQNETALLRRLDALERIRQHRQQILRRRAGRPLELDPNNLVDQLRDERDDELFNHLFPTRD